MKLYNHIRLSFILLLGDIAAVNLGFLFAYWLRFESGFFHVHKGIPDVSIYMQLAPIITVIYVFLLRAEKLYVVRSRISIVDEVFSIMRADTVGLMVFMAGTFVYRSYSFSRGMLIVAWVTLLLSISVWRFLVNRVRFFMRKFTVQKRNLLLVGHGPMVGRLVEHIMGDMHWDYRVTGILKVNGDTPEISAKGEKVKVLGALRDLGNVLDANKVEEVIVADADISREEILNIMMECDKRMVEFRLVADILCLMTSQVDMRSIDGIPLLGLKETPLSEGYNRFLKRSSDIAVSAVCLIIFLPFLLAIAILIKATSKGKVFYYQKRVGEDGKRFSIIKFRTMVDNAEKGVGMVWAKEDDPRKTKIGAVLRRYNLDEVPQLINVLRGDMSLVGPRPERPHFVKKFRESIPRYMSRHKIKSGMTGWAQVNGLRGNTSIEERTKYDLYYIENWSLFFDIRIMLMSIFAMKNAY
ncbi:MAG: undecaprenyl-phosphate glucose phosphotransferase [Candidatus Omnitrophica bacterium]|nr:undecaprenyl-phosphate glucose phosphotransferase [Candidatus Omnitrophota bacterium]